MSDISSPREPFVFGRFLASDMRRFKELTVPPGRAVGPLWTALLSPRFAPILLLRICQGLRGARLGPLAKLVSLINFVAFGVEVASQTRIGKGLFFPHSQGIVIGAASIGDNVTIYHNVTLGALGLDLAFTEAERPSIGDGVIIASGAKILGGVHVGDCARIGANALVLKAVPAGAVARAPLAEVILKATGVDDAE